MSNLLYEPETGVEFRARNEIQLLKVQYGLFRVALSCLVFDWLKGKVGTGAPTDEWEKRDIAEVNEAVNGDGQQLEKLHEKTKMVYDELVQIKVPGHFKVATSHRRWIRLVYQFLQRIGANFSVKMDEMIHRHDLSKYTHREVLGYAVMFGDGSINWRHLESEAEKIEWETTLHNHYAGNPHHPEYFYPLQKDGKRDKSVPMLKLDPVNGRNFVDESIIDMLAARGERELGKDPEFDVKKWFAVEEKYLFRYAEEDKAYVNECLKEFEELAERFFSLKENAESMNRFFDDRAVVYKS